MIAGLEERLAMNRPVAQDMLDQFTLHPLVGLEHCFEILQGSEEPQYHCALCSLNISLVDLAPHLTSLDHVLVFLKEFIPIAWARFSPIPDINSWMLEDFNSLNSILWKIEKVYSRKALSMIASVSDLEEKISKIPRDIYSVRKAELDRYVKSISPAAPRLSTHRGTLFLQKKCWTRLAALGEVTEIPPNSSQSVVLKILGTTNLLKEGRFVKVMQNPAYQGPLEVKPAIGRVWRSTAGWFVRTTLDNKLLTTSAAAQPSSELVTISWAQ